MYFLINFLQIFIKNMAKQRFSMLYKLATNVFSLLDSYQVCVRFIVPMFYPRTSKGGGGGGSNGAPN